MKIRKGKLSVAVISLSMASVVVSGLGVSAASAASAATSTVAASNSKFCADYTHAAKVSTLKQIRAAIPELKKLEGEAPGSIQGEIKQFVGYVQQLTNGNGKFSSKTKEKAFEKLATKLSSQTDKLCK